MTRNFWFPDARPHVLTTADACLQDLTDLQQAIAELGTVRLAQHEDRFQAFTGSLDRHEVLARWNRANDRLDDACAAVEVRAERLARALGALLPRSKPSLH